MLVSVAGKLGENGVGRNVATWGTDPFSTGGIRWVGDQPWDTSLFSGQLNSRLLGHLVDQAQQVEMALGQQGTRTLVAAVFGGPFSDRGALCFGNRVEPIFTRFTAGQDIAGVELAGGAPVPDMPAVGSREGQSQNGNSGSCLFGWSC